jgi:DtxR family Mn-dependent transcriptional regulator
MEEFFVNTERREKEEYLEKLWEMSEQGQEPVEQLRKAMESDFDTRMIEDLVREDLVELTKGKQKIALTEKGKNHARKIIRAHRIGERLLYDIFGGDFEKGACEFEHTITDEIVNGICTLLGHPRECPHGMPIPEGDCCRVHAKATPNLVTPVTELEIGQSARIAYINCSNDRQMHRLNGQQIRPGTIIKLHQKYPCYVVECEDASIALDTEIASNICVWSNTPHFEPARKKTIHRKMKRGSWWKKFFTTPTKDAPNI